MTESPARLHVEAAFQIAHKQLSAFFKAQRSAELRDKPFKKYDGRGFDVLSLEAGRIFALVELCPDLSVDLAEMKADARQDALIEWRKEMFAEWLPGAEVA